MNKINTKELHQIFVNLKENREKSFNELYEKYGKLIYAISFSILKNKENSEDIVQIVFTKIYRLDNKKLPETNEASWLYTLTKNESLNYLKKQNNIVALEELMDNPYVETELNKIIDEDSYKRLMNKLDEKEREIVNLKVIAGMKFKDISNLLNMPMRNSPMEILYCIT